MVRILTGMCQKCIEIGREISEKLIVILHALCPHHHIQAFSIYRSIALPFKYLLRIGLNGLKQLLMITATTITKTKLNEEKAKTKN